MFHQGSRYCLIRMCNKLLKNLSVNSQDEAAHFAGEISLTLASVFPLSERSAANVLGAFHTDEKYQVDYETLEEWMENSTGGGDGHVSGNHETSTTKGGKNVALSYGFYSKFWSLQKVFTDPRGLLPKSGDEWSEHMERFVLDVQDILGTFDGYKFSGDEVKDLKAKWDAMRMNSMDKGLAPSSMTGDVEMEDVSSEAISSDDNMSQAKRQYKYLTSSHLLHWQLQDPEIRIHFLSQLLIISSFLSKSLSEYASSPTGDATTDKGIYDKVQSSLHSMGQLAEELMKQVPPNGELHLNTLRWILRERESIWRGWKSNKCTPSIEKFAANNKDGEKEKNAVTSDPRGPQKGKSILSVASKYVYDIDLVINLPQISKKMSEHHKATDQFFEEYVDALDPDAGIEEEYHPKRNKLSCWRALRLLTKNHIGHFGDREGKCMVSKKTGDFEGILRTIWKDEKGVEVAGDAPCAELIADDDVGGEDVEATAVPDISTDVVEDHTMGDETQPDGNVDEKKIMGPEENKKNNNSKNHEASNNKTNTEEKDKTIKSISRQSSVHEDETAEAGEIDEAMESTSSQPASKTENVMVPEANLSAKEVARQPEENASRTEKDGIESVENGKSTTRKRKHDDDSDQRSKENEMEQGGNIEIVNDRSSAGQKRKREDDSGFKGTEIERQTESSSPQNNTEEADKGGNQKDGSEATINDDKRRSSQESDPLENNENSKPTRGHQEAPHKRNGNNEKKRDRGSRWNTSNDNVKELKGSEQTAKNDENQGGKDTELMPNVDASYGARNDQGFDKINKEGKTQQDMGVKVSQKEHKTQDGGSDNKSNEHRVAANKKEVNHRGNDEGEQMKRETKGVEKQKTADKKRELRKDSDGKEANNQGNVADVSHKGTFHTPSTGQQDIQNLSLTKQLINDNDTSKPDVKVQDTLAPRDDLKVRREPETEHKNKPKPQNAEKQTSTRIREDGKRNNMNHGGQARSFNSFGYQRGNDRKQTPPPLPNMPPPSLPPRHEIVRDSRGGHGTHTRFFSPDSRDHAIGGTRSHNMPSGHYQYNDHGRGSSHDGRRRGQNRRR